MSAEVVPIQQRGEFPPAPWGLSNAMTSFWEEIMKAYELDPHHLRILQRACESWDVAETALKVVQEEGATFLDRFDQPKERPETAIWRASVTLFRQLLRELQLDALAAESPRTPRLY